MLLAALSAAYATDITWTNADGGNWSDSGNWNPAQVPDENDNALITTDGTYTVTLDINVTFTGLTLGGSSDTQTLLISNRTLTLNGPGSIGAQGVLELAGGILAGSGDVVVDGRMEWPQGSLEGSGTLTIDAAATLEISGNTGSPALSRRLDNAGSATLPPTANFNFHILSGGVFNNLEDALFDIQSDADLLSIAQDGEFNNAGTFRKSGGGISIVDVAFENMAAGTVDQQSGTLSFSHGTTSTGAILITDGANLEIVPAGATTAEITGALQVPASSRVTIGGSGPSRTITLNTNDKLDGAGTVQISGPTTILGAGAYEVTGMTEVAGNGILDLRTTSGASMHSLNVTGIVRGSSAIMVTDSMEWPQGSLEGSGILTIDAAATLEISSSAGSPFLSRRLDNAGSATLPPTANFNFHILSGGVFNNLEDALFDIQSDADLLSFAQDGEFNNAGTFRKSGGGISIVDLPFENSGALEARSGVIVFQKSITQTSGSMTLNGGDISSTETLEVQGGSVGCVGTITGNVVSSGTVAPGLSAGTLSIAGNYTQMTEGELFMEIGGRIQGTDYDYLEVTGTATIDGALRLGRLDEFQPDSSDTFTILSASTRKRTFVEKTGTDAGNGNYLYPEYQPGFVVLVVKDGTPRVESSSLKINGGLFQFRFTGAVGQYRIEASVDLENWVIVATPTLDENFFVFSDPDSGGFTHRFYRVVFIPQ